MQFKNVGMFDTRFLLFRRQSPSDRHEHPVSSGTDVRHTGAGRERTRIWGDGAVHGVLASSQDPGNIIHLRESWCKFLLRIPFLGTWCMCSSCLREKDAAKHYRGWQRFVLSTAGLQPALWGKENCAAYVDILSMEIAKLPDTPDNNLGCLEWHWKHLWQ